MADAASKPPPEILGYARMAHQIFKGADLSPLRAYLERMVEADPEDAATWLDLGVLLELTSQKEEGLACQARALQLKRVFRLPAGGSGPGLRLLVFVAPGDIQTNVPLPFLLLDSDVTVDLVFLQPGLSLPEPLPTHDLALVGVGEADASHPFLDQLESLGTWPRPILLNPAAIRSMERDRLWRLLEGVPGLRIPPTLRTGRGGLGRLAGGESPAGLPPGAGYPYVLRPVDSHAGHGLVKVDTPQAVADYLGGRTEEVFFLSPFVDYRGPDGLFRKYRVTLVEGEAFICHMALAEHWMLHYLNAGMDGDPTKRAEEARAFATFDEGFGRRHAQALRVLHERAGLEYFSIDCAETRDGELLIFEAGTAMVVHDMDPPDLYPYKPPQMRRIFRAFREMLGRHAGL